MADFTDRIKLVIDVVGDQAASGINNVKSSVGGAESAFGKLKGAASSAIDMVASSPAAMAGAAIAIGKVAFDLASGFEQAALSASKFSTASGLSVEDASRWQEVAGDVGVSTETLEGAVQKLDKAAGTGVLTKLGIGGDTTNERLLNALSYLNGISDAGERAVAGAQIFGKSWAQLAPLVKDSAALRDNLAAVSDAKVIDQGEVRKAEQFRDAMDALNDRLEDLKNTLGEELIGPFSDFMGALDGFASQIGTVTDKIPGMSDGLLGFAAAPLRNAADGLNTMFDSQSSVIDQFRGLGQATLGSVPIMGSWAGSLFDVEDKADKAADATAAQANATKVMTAAAQEAADAVDKQNAAIDALTKSTLASFNGQLAVADASDKTTDAITKYTKAFDTANASAFGNSEANTEVARAQRDAEQAALAQAAAMAKLASDQAVANGASAESVNTTSLQADALRTVAGTLAADSPLRRSLLAYADQLDKIPPKVDTSLNLSTAEAQEELDAFLNQKRQIEIQAFIKETGASVFRPPGTSSSSTRSANAVPSMLAAPMAASAPATTIVNVNVHAAPLTHPAEVGRQVADYLDAFYRRNGTRLRAVP